MIIADTNVISESIKKSPNADVLSWLASNKYEIVITAITLQELYFGVLILPSGRRKDELLGVVENLASSARKILPYTEAAARVTGEIMATSKKKGINHPRPEDLQIAGIALSLNLPLATRNTKHFAHLGLELINPWNSQHPASVK